MVIKHIAKNATNKRLMTTLKEIQTGIFCNVMVLQVRKKQIWHKAKVIVAPFAKSCLATN